MENSTRLILIAVLACLSVTLWMISIALTLWDANRQQLPATEKVAWMALVVVLPGVGFGAYLFWRLLTRLLAPRPTAEDPEQLRFTMVKRVEPASPDYHGTIPAFELLKRTTPEAGRQAAPAPLTVTVLAGPHNGQIFNLPQLPATIGRGADADVRLDQDRGVSRQHAELYRQGERLRLRDLRSTHGTYINDFSVDDKGLEPGDRIRLGASVLSVQEANQI